VIRGIDVAVYQRGFDWAAARKAGVRFAIIKATQDGSMVDGAFREHLAAARKAGIDVLGAYHFLINPKASGGQRASGAAQAENFVRTVRAANGGTLDGLLLALDVENLPSRKSNPKAPEVRAFAARFRQLAGADRPLLLYTSPGKWSGFGKARDLMGAQTYLWMADWRPAAIRSRGFGGLKPVIVQHGRSPIIKHRGKGVDGNTSDLTIAQLRDLTRPKAAPPAPDPEPAPPTTWLYCRRLQGAVLRPLPSSGAAPIALAVFGSPLLVAAGPTGSAGAAAPGEPSAAFVAVHGLGPSRLDPPLWVRADQLGKERPSLPPPPSM